MGELAVSKDVYLGFPVESSPTLLGGGGHQQDALLECLPHQGIAGLAMVGPGVLSPCPQPAGRPGAVWSGVCMHPSRACAAVTLQRLISGGFLGNSAASTRRERSPRQLQPRRVVTGTRLGEMAFPRDELLRLGVGKRDASASFHQLPSDSQKAFSLLLWCACRP